MGSNNDEELSETSKPGGGVSSDVNNQGHTVFKKGSQQEQDEEEEKYEDPVKKGQEDAIKDTIKDREKGINKFYSLVDQSEKILFEAKSVFPFDFFPDTISVDISKVNIRIGEFFMSGRTHSVFIEDISDVFVESGPIFSTLKIIDVGFVENSIDIRHLRVRDAQKARRIIQGLVVAKRQGIELSAINNIPDLVEKLEKLGAIREKKT